MKVGQYQLQEDLYYDENNYWLKINRAEAIIGMTDYGQSTIGDILYLELLPVNTTVSRGGDLGSIESGKWIGKISAPVSATVIETNEEIKTNPRLANSEPYKKGWLFRIKLNDLQELKELMDVKAYNKWLEKQIVCDNEGGVN